MKKIAITTIGIFSLAALAVSCSDIHREPGRVYMPDMAYSRAYETYAERDSSEFTMDRMKRGHQIFYNSIPVKGTIKRGEIFPYPLENDSNGYKMSSTVQNPFQGSLSAVDLVESGRLFNINCAICHGEKAAGNGPLSTGGKIGGVANLTLPNYIAMADGTMFHSVEYGKGVMGSYASQLSREQRWKIIKYIRTLQNGNKPVSDSTSAGAATVGSATKDTTKKM